VSKSHLFVWKSHSAFINDSCACRNHIRTCQNHKACKNYTLCVLNYTLRDLITLERVIITLMSVIFTCIRVKITLVCVNLTLRVKSHYACEDRTLRVEINLFLVSGTSIFNSFYWSLRFYLITNFLRYKTHWVFSSQANSLKQHTQQHLLCVVVSCARWNHTRACCNHIHTFRNHPACRNYTVEQKKSLYRS
jgi:hypothetical protein